jgi:DNA-binding protein HU-beta
MAMNTPELVSFIAEQTFMPKKSARSVLDALIQAIHLSLKRKRSVEIPNFGIFTVSERKARTGVNPRTLDKMNVPAKTVPYFRASNVLRQAVKNAK